MPRWLRVLLVVCTLAFASSLPGVEDPCVDECEDTCGCLCRAPYATPPAPAAVRVVDSPRLVAVALVTPPPQSPPPRGVFHPPRPSA